MAKTVKRGRKSSRRPAKRKHRPDPPSEVLDVRIHRLGAQGDGVAVLDDGRTLYVAQALPGELLKVKTGARQGDGLAAQIVEVIEPSPDRVAPICPHYGTCGGCQLQHLDPVRYADFKRDRIIEALQKRGFEAPPVADTVAVPLGSRRRVSFSAIKIKGSAVVGFHAQHSHDVINIDACPLLVDELNALLDPLRGLASTLLSRDGLPGGSKLRILATACSGGLDVLLSGLGEPDFKARETIAAFVQGGHALRVSWDAGDGEPEPIAQASQPLITLGGVPVGLPSGAFLQASRAGEQALVAEVLDATGGAKRIADLYSGLGSFALPLAAHTKAHVLAIDVTKTAIQALQRAAGQAALGGYIEAEARDLDRRPLSVKELSNFDAVVFDPPRAGAKVQVEVLAEAAVPHIAAVSCNPATFARDARILVDGGYQLVRCVPVDQFLYSGHIELVAHFSRPE